MHTPLRRALLLSLLAPLACRPASDEPPGLEAPPGTAGEAAGGADALPADAQAFQDSVLESLSGDAGAAQAPADAPAPPEDMPVYPGTDWEGDVWVGETGARGNLFTPDPPETALAVYLGQLSDEGWEIEYEQDIPGDAQLISLRKPEGRRMAIWVQGTDEGTRFRVTAQPMLEPGTP